MRLLSLDFDPIYGEGNTRAQFSGDISVFDYDVVIWDPAASFQTYVPDYPRYYKNLLSLPEHSSVRIANDVARRRAEFLDFIQSGRTLVVVVSPPQDCWIDSGDREHSGTGRNRQSTVLVNKLDLLSALPISKTLKFAAATGNRIDLDGSGPLVSLLRKYKERVRYDAVMTNTPGTVLAHVAGTDRHVAALLRAEGGGHLVLLPLVDLEARGEDIAEGEIEDADQPEGDDESGDDWDLIAPEFQADLLAALEQLSGSRVESRPAWATQYSTAAQSELRKAVVAQQEEIEKARAVLADLQRQQEQADARDQLFLGTGRALELEVRGVLKLLGGEVTEPAPGRDDWRVTFPEGTAVVEVKGVSKSAAEKHAAQLEKWVATALEETGVAPKGILVVNTWRETPLSERTGENFPNQMLAYSKSRNHCLVSGLQLFVIREEIETDPARAEHWRKKLVGTSGVLVGATGWKTHLKRTVGTQ